MAHAEAVVTINRPLKDVFNFVLDGENNPHWRPSCIDAKRLTGKPDSIGSKFKQGLKGPGGARIDGDYEIVKLEPNRLIEFQVIAGPARPKGTFTFQPAETGTTLTFTLHLEPKGLQKLMDGMINNQMQAEVSNLSNLKAYMEGHE